MSRIAICGFYGWYNSGDEGILLSIMDALGNDNEYVVYTNLPWTLAEDYRRKNSSIQEARQIYDVRTDYDAFILGGGALSWGFGWRQALTAWSALKPSMSYGVGYDKHQIYHFKLMRLYAEFLRQFDEITVRDEHSQSIAFDLGIEATLTMCPSINLKEEEFDCPKNTVVVCPRYEDYGSNEPQLEWLTTRLADVKEEILAIPFAPYNREGVPVDLELCRELIKRIKRGKILMLDGFSPRKVKYAISQSKKVISGGRYHALVWAAAHNIPFEACPTALANYPKVKAFQDMYQKYGSEKLKKMEKENKRIFLKTIEERAK